MYPVAFQSYSAKSEVALMNATAWLLAARRTNPHRPGPARARVDQDHRRQLRRPAPRRPAPGRPGCCRRVDRTPRAGDLMLDFTVTEHEFEKLLEEDPNE